MLESREKKYEMKEIVKELKESGFKYSAFGLQKQISEGCVPSYEHVAHKKVLFSERDYKYIKFTVVRRTILGLPLKVIEFIHAILYKWECYIEKNNIALDNKEGMKEYFKIYDEEQIHTILRAFNADIETFIGRKKAMHNFGDEVLPMSNIFAEVIKETFNKKEG